MNDPWRPPKYKTPEELQEKIKEYFTNCPDKRPIYNKLGKKVAEVPELTLTGLALHCGFCSRQSFYDYEKKNEFSYTIKRARALIEQVYEKLLQRGLGAGAIFALKNFGWRDNQDQDNDETIEEAIEIINKDKEIVNRIGKYAN